jgi:hypothetical protein
MVLYLLVEDVLEDEALLLVRLFYAYSGSQLVIDGSDVLFSNQNIALIERAVYAENGLSRV